MLDEGTKERFQNCQRSTKYSYIQASVADSLNA